MQRSFPQAQVFAGALAAGFFLTTGCVTTTPVAPPSPANAEQRIEALSHYATGCSIELTQGLNPALPFYRRALELDPGNLPLALRLAQIHLARKEFDAARQLLDQTRTNHPAAPEPWFWLGVVNRADEKPAAAVAAFEQALKVQPTYLDAVPMLLEIHLQAGNDQAAVETLNRAWSQPSADPRYWLRLGEIYSTTLRQKPSLSRLLNPARVPEAFEKARSLAPQDTEILTRLGDFYAAEDPGKAAALYEQLFAEHPTLPKLREKLAVAYIRAGQPEKALPLLEELIKREPLRVEIYNLLGDVYDDLDKHERALSAYQQSLVINPNQLAPYLHIFVLQMKLKQYNDARATLDTAARNFPTAPVIPFYYGIYYTDRKDYTNAVTYFADAEILATDAGDSALLDSTFYFHYGAACERAGHTDQAVQLLRKSLALNPDNHQALNWLGYLWADKGENLDEARQLIEKAVKLDPDNGAYRDSLGWVLFKQGRAQEALPHLQHAAELQKEDPTVLEHLADVLLALGQRDAALLHLRHAARLAPDNKDLAAKLEKLAAPAAP
jgi:tetratricopeptide (TPR) repeat protein